MPFIIDGHNLIPKIPGLSLQDIDDEQQLLDLLQEFCRVNRKHVEVFFDNAPPGQPSARSFGSVVARFVREGRTADQAIRSKLNRLGGEARNWTVVSSDREVQINAKALRSRVISSEDFAQQLREAMDNSGGKTSERENEISPQELDDWMQIFGFEEGEED
jgi:predicted RNA-binding protein with PIN domain